MSVVSTRGTPGRLVSVVIAILMVAAFMPLSAGTAAIGPYEYYVDAVNGNDTTGDGSVNDPWRSISKANSLAASGDTVWIEPGTYDGTVEASFPIKVVSGVAFRSTEGARETTVQADGAHAVFEVRDPLPGSAIDGLVITGGGSVNGGGVNIRRYDTSAVAVGVPEIEDCYIHGNERDGSLGGGISVWGAVDATCAPRVQGCVIAENSANYGGGISVSGEAIVAIEESTIENNVVKYSGGGVYVVGEFDVEIARTDIMSNEATAGGGIYTEPASSESTLEMEDIWILENEATSSRGGGLWANGGIVRIDAAKIADNTSSGDGGGICLAGTKGYLSDCFIMDNNGEDGGGINLRSSSETTITHCTIDGNNGTSFHGIYSSSSTLNIFNSLIGDHGYEDIGGSGVTVSYSNIEDSGIGGTGVIHADPMYFDEEFGDLRLKLGSPCIDSAGFAESDSADYWNQNRPEDGDDIPGAVPDMGAWERPGLEVERYAGANRYDTACQMAEAAFESADTAVIASGENFPDALSAAGLAGAEWAPLLLTKSTSVPSQVQTTLDNLGVERVVIVGGEAAVSSDVYDWLFDNEFDVSRIYGNTRYETSAQVALEIEAIAGDDELGSSAFFARGDAFPDALAAAPLAYGQAVPILLVKPSSVPGAITDVMDTLHVDEGFVLGGTSAISAPAKAVIDAEIVSNGGSNSERWEGSDRYETAAVVAENGCAIEWGSMDYVGIAVGTNFPDALAGGVTAGKNDGVLLLTKVNSLPTETHDFLTDNSTTIIYAEVYGGVSAVSDAVNTAVYDALGW